VDEVAHVGLVDGGLEPVPREPRREVDERLDGGGDGDSVAAGGVDGLAAVEGDAGTA
jgi:hypothetical protein